MNYHLLSLRNIHQHFRVKCHKVVYHLQESTGWSMLSKTPERKISSGSAGSTRNLLSHLPIEAREGGKPSESKWNALGFPCRNSIWNRAGH